ncbi:MAG: DUF309 domain-containing protein [Rhizobiaceae bacterium]
MGTALDIDTYPLPKTAHVPGVNDRQSQMMLLEQVAAQSLSPTSDLTWRENPAWLYGLRLLRNGYYWEAHEVFEAVWMNAVPNSRERHLVQGVIHLANAALKVRMDRVDASLRLCELAEECFRRSFAQLQTGCLMGLKPGILSAAAIKIRSNPPDLSGSGELTLL